MCLAGLDSTKPVNLLLVTISKAAETKEIDLSVLSTLGCRRLEMKSVRLVNQLNRYTNASKQKMC